MVSRTFVKWIKLTFIISTASFLLIQIQMRRGENDYVPSVPGNGNVHVGRPAITSTYQNDTRPEIKEPKMRETEKLHDSTTLKHMEDDGPSEYELRRIIEQHNSKYEIYNDRFGPIETIQYVLVIQVHNRTKYLEQLINSLSQARGIERTLLIFSHDHYSTALNNLIRGITFCRTMQIFYPYSIQAYSNRFPGQDPNDCPGNIGKEKAEEIKCQNWRSPDKYGHYRVAQFSQVKHHWWWKMNYVFDGIPGLRNYTGWVLRLEEDHYVSPDFLHTFDYIVNNKEKLCAECNVITLGFYLKTYNDYSSTMKQLAVFPWFSSRHNMGMAINRSTWASIRECSELFCTYDDYNWDWSLMHLNLKCLKERMTVIYAKSPRVFHIGDCGIHHSGKQCTADSSATKVRAILESVKGELFPAQLDVAERSSRTLKAPKENGGWGDIRDHELCKNNSYFNQLPLDSHLQRLNTI